LLTYAVTWTFFLTALALPRETPFSDPALTIVRGLLVFGGAIAPAFVALAITARAGGISAATAPLQGLFQWRVGVRWYLFAVSYMAAIRVAVALAHRMLTGAWPRLGSDPWIAAVAAIIISTPFQAGEEIGWRGYALPRLLESLGFARASVLLGLIWAGWHLPLFFLPIPGNDEYGQSFPIWALGVTALSVAIAWLYTHTNGSLLLTMLMHSAVNNIPHFVPSAVADASKTFSLQASSTAWLTAVCLWIAAVYFLVRNRHNSVRSRDAHGSNVLGGRSLF
jgi:membrane protease YdiL (CAAX protease family)